MPRFGPPWAPAFQRIVLKVFSKGMTKHKLDYLFSGVKVECRLARTAAMSAFGVSKLELGEAIQKFVSCGIISCIEKLQFNCDRIFIDRTVTALETSNRFPLSNLKLVFVCVVTMYVGDRSITNTLGLTSRNNHIDLLWLSHCQLDEQELKSRFV